MSRLTVMTCSMGGNIQNVDFLRPIIEKLDMDFVTISEWDCHDIKWDRNTWLHNLSKADIIICVQKDIQPAKSNNRLTQAMSLGKPVCASPLQAYKEVIVNGYNGFICETVEEWETNLNALKECANLRLKIGANAKMSVTDFSISKIGNSWKNLFDKLTINCEQPKVDIIIPTWNNLELLQQCIKSIHLNTDWPYNIIVVNSGNDGTREWLASQPSIIVYNSNERLHFSAANNIGLLISKEQYVCFLNDDTIVSEYWLTALMDEAIKPGVGVVNPWSNCDKWWLHNDDFVVDGVDLVPGMTFESVKNIIPKLYKCRKQKKVTKRNWVAFFCSLIPRSVIDRVGQFDEVFKSGCEDLDYCRRISNLGYSCITTDDSFVFHFGGSSRKNSEKIDHHTHHLEDQINHRLLNAKYQKTLTMYTGQALEHWCPTNINEFGIGGSETCAAYVCKEFAKRGYKVKLYGYPGKYAGFHDGVEYIDYLKFNPQDRTDIFISSRRSDVFANGINSKIKICWVHDIWLHHDHSHNINIDKIDKFFVLSPWHFNFFCNHHKVPRHKVFLTRDTIDRSRFDSNVERIDGRMIYSSSPDRGLKVLLECMPSIRSRVPNANLRIFYGFDNWQRMAELNNNHQEMGRIKYLKSKLDQPGVEYIGRIDQNRLALEFKSAKLWAYPTFFYETFCITACEAMAAGTPIVTSNLAALSTTVGNNGILIDGNSNTSEYKKLFIDSCVNVLSDVDLWNRLSNAGLRASADFGWDKLVDEWIAEFEK